jgi:hypothetical protein
MNIERVDPVVLIHQSPDVERAKGDRERRPREDDKDEHGQGEQSPPPPAPEQETAEPGASAEQKRAPVVIYQPSAEQGVRKHEADQDSTIDYKG